MVILVTGANGQLGNEMRIVTKRSKDTYIFTDVIEADGQEANLLGLVDFECVIGSVCCIGSAVSTVIRTALGRNDLFLLDGGPE